MAIHDAQLGYEMADRLIVIDKGSAALDFRKANVSLSEFQDRFSAVVSS
jgi:ABC-type cobalamin/Fe3+-siderophores transport system ATPase subunit